MRATDVQGIFFVGIPHHVERTPTIVACSKFQEYSFFEGVNCYDVSIHLT
jgi:hypothetical protein